MVGAKGGGFLPFPWLSPRWCAHGLQCSVGGGRLIWIERPGLSARDQIPRGHDGHRHIAACGPPQSHLPFTRLPESQQVRFWELGPWYRSRITGVRLHAKVAIGHGRFWLVMWWAEMLASGMDRLQKGHPSRSMWLGSPLSLSSLYGDEQVPVSKWSSTPGERSPLMGRILPISKSTARLPRCGHTCYYLPRASSGPCLEAPAVPTKRGALPCPACMVWRMFRGFLLARAWTGCPIRCGRVGSCMGPGESNAPRRPALGSPAPP